MQKFVGQIKDNQEEYASYSISDLQDLEVKFGKPITRLERLCNVDLIRMITPIDIWKVREYWLKKAQEMQWPERATKGGWIAPEFQYDSDYLEYVVSKSDELDDITRQLILARVSNKLEDFFVDLLLRRTQQLDKTIQIAQAMLRRNNVRVNTLAQEKYGVLDTEVFLKANEFAGYMCRGEDRLYAEPRLSRRDIEKLESKVFDAKAIKYWFKRALKAYGINNWRVKIDKNVTAIDAREGVDGRPTVLIPSNRRVNGRKLLKLIRHEIECHVRDSENGKRLLCGIGGGVLRSDNDTLYEGHAMYEEAKMELELFGSCPKMPLPWYIIAMNGACQGYTIDKIARDIYRLRALVLENKGVKNWHDRALRQTWVTMYRAILRGGNGNSRKRFGYYFLKDKAYFEGKMIADELNSYETNDGISYGRWLEIGALDPRELLRLSEHIQLQSIDLPYPDLHWVANNWQRVRDWGDK